MKIDGAALDRYITGNYGDDGSHDKFDEMLDEAEYLLQHTPAFQGTHDRKLLAEMLDRYENVDQAVEGFIEKQNEDLE